MMISKICKTGMVAVALTLPQVALAGTPDSMRCDALAMRKEAQLFSCLSSCQGLSNGRRADRLGSAADALIAQCQQNCHDRYNSAMQSLDQQCVVGPPPPPDAAKCTAEVLRAKAAQLTCKRGCGVQAQGRRAVDPTICDDLCDAQYNTTITRLMATSYCAGIMPDLSNLVH
jgi:hypothetical protein